jgi:hypothetical protein
VFLTNMEPDHPDVPETSRYRAGREAIELLAHSSPGTSAPQVSLPLHRCADIVHFLSWSQPREKVNWWSEGLGFIFGAIEGSIRDSAELPATDIKANCVRLAMQALRETIFLTPDEERTFEDALAKRLSRRSQRRAAQEVV